MYFFVAAQLTEDADVGGYSTRLGHVSGKTVLPLDILGEPLQAAGG